MDWEQKRNYIYLLYDKLFEVYISKCIFVKHGLLYVCKNYNANEYISLDLDDDDNLVMREVACDEKNNLCCNIIINEPHIENLIKFVGIYFEKGKGEDSSNFTIKELICGTNVKSARNI